LAFGDEVVLVAVVVVQHDVAVVQVIGDLLGKDLEEGRPVGLVDWRLENV
jgi:hypothetical protein